MYYVRTPNSLISVSTLITPICPSNEAHRWQILWNRPGKNFHQEPVAVEDIQLCTGHQPWLAALEGPLPISEGLPSEGRTVPQMPVPMICPYLNGFIWVLPETMDLIALLNQIRNINDIY